MKYADTNGDGTIDLRDRVSAGSYQPPMYFGINGGLTFSGLDLSFVFCGNVNNDVYNRKKQATGQVTDNVEADFAANRWTTTNPSTTNPSAIRNNTPNSTYFIESGSFMRLNNLVLGYTIPTSLIERAHLSSLRVFATAQNLFTITNYSGFTPELPGGPLDSGIEATTYPTSRTLALGLNVNFKSAPPMKTRLTHIPRPLRLAALGLVLTGRCGQLQRFPRRCAPGPAHRRSG